MAKPRANAAAVAFLCTTWTTRGEQSISVQTSAQIWGPSSVLIHHECTLAHQLLLGLGSAPALKRMNRMRPRQRFQELPQPTHQSLKDLHDYWLSKKGTRNAPPRSAIRPDEIVKLVSSIALLDVIGDPPRFRFRLFGTALTAAYGQDLTGKFVDEIDVGGKVPPEILASATKVVRECCINVGRSQYTKTVDQRHVEYERILLPLSEDGEKVSMILCGYAIETAYG